jgi:ribosomal protein S27E
MTRTARKEYSADCRGCGRTVGLARQRKGENVELPAYARVRCSECETITVCESTGAGDGSVLDNDGPEWLVDADTVDVVFSDEGDT